MSKIFKSAITSTVKRAKGVGTRIKTALLFACAVLLNPMGAFAQSLANTGYEAGTNAMEEVATQIAAYIPYVVNLCYALAGVVAIVGAISVYIAMNNEEQDVKNILVLKNWLKTIRKEMKQKFLCISHLQGYFAFPIFENMTLKKI
jgi:molybdate-binding protein